MTGKFKNVWLLVACICLLSRSLAIASDSETHKNILSRIQTIDNPELGEIIKIAIENSPEIKNLDEYRLGLAQGTSADYRLLVKAADAARPKIVRCVTESYTQVKFLDTQIEQINRKIDSSKIAETVRSELILARAELEAKRTTELAKLREIMNVIPKHAFGRIPANTLKNWLVLEVINDDIVYVFKKRPIGFIDKELFTNYRDIESIKLMSQAELISYLKNLLTAEENLPLRVVIARNISGIEFSEKLYNQVIKVVSDLKRQMKVDVYLDDRIPQAGKQFGLYLKERKIYWGKNSLEENRYVQEGEQHFYEEDIPNLLNTPGYLPLKLTINFDEESKDIVMHMSKAMKKAAKELGAEELIDIEQKEFIPNEVSP